MTENEVRELIKDYQRLNQMAHESINTYRSARQYLGWISHGLSIDEEGVHVDIFYRDGSEFEVYPLDLLWEVNMVSRACSDDKKEKDEILEKERARKKLEEETREKTEMGTYLKLKAKYGGR